MPSTSFILYVSTVRSTIPKAMSYLFVASKAGPKRRNNALGRQTLLLSSPLTPNPQSLQLDTMANQPPKALGHLLPSGVRITHGAASNIKHPFPDTPLSMHELSASNPKGFHGPLGIINFTTALRLPRHVHLNPDQTSFVDERIMVLHGVGMVEVCGTYVVVPPMSLTDIPGGVPHTWTACPAGVVLEDGTVSEGKERLGSVGEYVRYEGDLEGIRFPEMGREEVVRRAGCVFGKGMGELKLA